MDTEENRLGKFVRKRRGKMSLRDFAEKCNISHAYLVSIEKGFDPRTGKPRKLTTEKLKALANGCGIDFIELAMLAENEDIDKIKERIGADKEYRRAVIGAGEPRCKGAGFR